MRALKRSIALLLAFCLAMTALLVWLIVCRPQTAAPREAAAVETVTDIPLTELAAVVVENQQASFAVMQTPDGVEMISATQAEYDSAQMQALLYAAAHMTGSRRNTDESTFAAFGMDQPRATIQLVMTDGTRRTLQILMTNPIDQNVYVYDDDSRSILLVSASVAELFLRSDLEFMGHSPLPIRGVSDFSSIRSLTMEFAEGTRSYTVTCTDTNYFLTSPIHQRVPSTMVVSNLFVPLLSVYADSFVAFGAELSDWGFDQADLRLTLETDEGIFRLLFLRREDGSCLMAQPHTGNVYEVDADVLDALTFDYTLFMGGTAIYYGAGDLSEILFDLPQRQLTLEVSGSGETLSMTLDGKTLTEQQMRALLSGMNSIPIVAEVSAAQADPGEAMLVMTVRTASGATEVISFAPMDNGLCYVTIQGDTNFACSREDVQGFADALLELTEE